MGSFAYICAISGLPIEAGTPVRFAVIAPTKTDHGASWHLRAFPIKAKYDDYGSVDSIDPAGSDFFFECLSQDIVERGVGNNTCHNVSVRKGMSQERWLHALAQKRIRAHARYPREVILVPKGVPTRKRIEKLLLKAGHALSEGRFQDVTQGYCVDYLRKGTVRIRPNFEYGDDHDKEALERIIPLLTKKYRVNLQMGVRDNRLEVQSKFPIPMESRIPSVPVDQVVIREDVWQGLLAIPFNYGSEGSTTLHDFLADALRQYNQDISRAEAKAALKAAIDKGTWSPEEKALRLQLQENYDYLDDHMRMPGPLSLILGTSVYDLRGFNLRSAWRLMVSKGLPSTSPSVRSFLTLVAETAYVTAVMGLLGIPWHKVHYLGPQFGEWGVQEKYFALLTGIAAKENTE